MAYARVISSSLVTTILFTVFQRGCPIRDGDDEVGASSKLQSLAWDQKESNHEQQVVVETLAHGHQHLQHIHSPKSPAVDEVAIDQSHPPVPGQPSNKTKNATDYTLIGDHERKKAEKSRKPNSKQPTHKKVATHFSHGVGDIHTDTHGKDKAPEKDRSATLLQVGSLTQIFVLCSTVAAILAVTFEVLHWRWSDVDWQRHDALLDTDPNSLDLGKLGLRGAGAIAWRYFNGDGKIYGTTIAIASVIMIVLGTLIEKQMNLVTGVFWDALQNKDYESFLSGLQCFLVMLPAAFLIWAYRSYINGMLTIHWQQSLVRHLQSLWLGHCAYCVGQLRAPNEKPGLENPDQRIEEDAPAFVGMWLDLFFGLLATIPTFVVWMPIVLSLSPDHIFAMESMPVFRPWLVVASLVWCLLTSLITHMIGKSIIVLTYAKERYYADFRMGLSRIRQNADHIAMLHAETSESQRLENYFEKIKRVFWERLQVDKIMSVVGFLLGQGSDLFPLIFLAHAYFNGSVGLGHFIRIRMAVSNIQSSMSWFVDSYVEIARFRAVSNRLVEMIEHCEGVRSIRLLSPKMDSSIPDGCLKLAHAQGCLPTGASLWDIKDIVFEEGSWTLVRGPEGSGKTTLMRLLAGTWPVQESTMLCMGKSKPASSSFCEDSASDLSKDEKASPKNDEEGSASASASMLFVPIGAHRLRIGLRLKQAVCYPRAEDEFSDNAVVEALKDVGLQKLLVSESKDGSDISLESISERMAEVGDRQSDDKDGEACDYSVALHGDHGDRALSAGESQRLELAHVLLTRPRWCFLDEPVSHVKEEEREPLFFMLRSRLKDSTTLVTITHDVTALSSIHDVQLELRDGKLCPVLATS